MKNAYAVKLQQRKRVERKAVFLDGIRSTTDFLQDVFTMALHREGFGRERINRVNGYVNEIIDQYSVMQDDDVDYANDKLKEAVRKVMGEDKPCR